MAKIFNLKTTIIFVALFTLGRAYVAATLQIHPDEAYYWMWSKFPALGYFDHPPFLAYFIKVFTLFSSAEVWVRMPALATAGFMSFVIWRIADKIYNNEQISSLSVVLLNTLPVAMTGSIIVTPDVPSFLFWGLGILFLMKLDENNSLFTWLLIGVAAGFGLTAKYTGVLFYLGLLTYLVLSDKRKFLLTLNPYAGLLVSFLIFLPVVLWNAAHDWISFSFQLEHGLGGNKLNAANLLEYAGSQMLAAGPFFWLAAVYCSIAAIISKNKKEVMLASFSLPIVVFFAYAALKRPGEANWPAMAYFSAAILVASLIVKSSGATKKLLIFFVPAVNIAIALLITLQARFGVLDLKRFSADLAKNDATNFFYGYRELGREIQKYDDVDFVVATSHQNCAEIYYYTDRKYPVTTAGIEKRKSQFDIWQFDKAMAGRNGLYVYLSDDKHAAKNSIFDEVVSTATLTITRMDFHIRSYTIIHGKNLRSLEK